MKKQNLLKYKGYYGTVEFSIEDNCLFGQVIGIRSLVNYEGETIEQLKAAFKEGVDDYLILCQETGTEPEKPYTGTFNIRIGKELHRDLDAISRAKGISLNKLVKDHLSTLSKNLE